MGDGVVEEVAGGGSTMKVPRPTPIYRIIHVDNLTVCIQRGGFHAPNYVPDDGLVYHTIHNVEIQNVRRQQTIPCGPRGTVHDYVSFYFGPRSPIRSGSGKSVSSRKFLNNSRFCSIHFFEIFLAFFAMNSLLLFFGEFLMIFLCTVYRYF